MRCRDEIVFEIPSGFVGVLWRFDWPDDVALDRGFGSVPYSDGSG